MFEAPRQSKSGAPASAELPAAPPAAFDFAKIFSTLWDGRKTIAGTTVAALLLAVVFVLVAPYHYTATTEILIDPADLHAVANEPTPSSQASDTALLLIDSQVRVLTSDDVLRRVVATQGLAHDPEFVGPRSPLRVLLDRLSAAVGRGKSPAAADPSLAALQALRRHVRVTRAERTFVVDVSVTSEESTKAARLANAVAQAYLVEQTEVRTDAARQISRSLGARLNELKERLHQAEERVQAFKTSHNIVDANGQLVNEQQLSDLDTQLAAARARTAAAKARLEQVEAIQDSKTDVGAFPAAVQSQTITALRSQYAEIMRLEAQQLTTLGDRHPAVIEVRAQAARLKRMIADEVNRIALAARADYRSAEASEDFIEHNVDALKQSTLATDAAMVSLRELQRDVQASRAVYESFLVRARETGAQEGVDTKNIQVISKADLPLNRSSPPSNTIVALVALILGVAAGGGLVLLRGELQRETPQGPSEVFAAFKTDNKRTAELPPLETAVSPPLEVAVSQPAEVALSPPEEVAVPPPIEAPAAIPVLAKLPGVEAPSDANATDDAPSRFAAGIRAVYEAVRKNHKQSGNPSVLIVAANDDKDTAAVALTLAAVAAANQRVLLIDADIERRTLSAIDADQSEAGLVDVAVGRRLLSDVVVRDRDTNISLIPFISPNSRRDRDIRDDDIRGAFAQTKLFDMVIVAAMDMKRDPSARFFADLVDHIVLVTKAAAVGTRKVDDFVSGLGVDARKVRGAVLTGEAA